eukprot:1145221-Pelagomonas_calceolata.AAC.2
MPLSRCQETQTNIHPMWHARMHAQHRCPAEVEDDGTCGQGLMLARYTRPDDPSRSTTRCHNPPQYDIFRTPPRFVFSLCWVCTRGAGIGHKFGS